MNTHASPSPARRGWTRARTLVALVTTLFLVAGIASAVFHVLAPIDGNVQAAAAVDAGWTSPMYPPHLFDETSAALPNDLVNGPCKILVTDRSDTIGDNNHGNLTITWSGFYPGYSCVVDANLSLKPTSGPAKIQDVILNGLPLGMSYAVLGTAQGADVASPSGSPAFTSVTIKITAASGMAMGVSGTLHGDVTIVPAADYTVTNWTGPTY